MSAEALGIFPKPDKEVSHSPFLDSTISHDGPGIHMLVEDASNPTPPVSVSDRSHEPRQTRPMNEWLDSAGAMQH